MWPSLFSRYILRETLALSLVMLVALSTIIMLGVVLQQLVTAGLGLRAFLQMLPYAMVISLQYALPCTLLFAVCSVYGRLSADNELIAVKSGGVHPFKPLVPIFILASIASPLVVLVNDLAVSWAQPGINRVVLHSVEEVVYSFLRSNGAYWTQSGLSIHVEDVQDRWLIHPTITMAGDRESTTIIAERAALHLDQINDKLVIELVNWQSDNAARWQIDGGQQSRFFEIPLEKATRKNRQALKISQVSLSELPIVDATLQHERRDHQQKIMAGVAIASLSGRFAMLDESHTHMHMLELNELSKQQFRLASEPWRRWALGFSCFSFVFMGAPLAIHRKSADYWTSFGVCFVPVLLMYYPLYAMGVDRAKNGAWPPYSPFIANIGMILFGLYFLRKVYRN